MHVLSVPVLVLLLALLSGCPGAPVKPDALPTTAPRAAMLARVNAALGDNPGGQVRFDRARPFTDSLVVERYELANGLGVLVMEDRSSPVFAYQTWFAVGSKDEKEGRTGIAHLFEHLLFKESENLGDGVFDRILELNGGRVNASTWVDWTYYRESLPTGRPSFPAEVPKLLDERPSDRLELAVRLEADRMAHMVLSDAQVEAEREVVKNERRYRVDNDPEGKMYEVLYSTAYSKHSYRWPTVGWMADLDAITREDCVAFYETYYSPNNATLVVVGDVDKERLLTLVGRYYGPMATQQIPEPTIETEPPQASPRRKELVMELSAAKVLVGYHVPAQSHPDQAALEVANELLLEGKSSRVYRRLVTEMEVASEVSGWVAQFAHPGILEVMIAMKRDQDPGQAERVLLEEIARLDAELVADAEIDKARNRLEAAFLRDLQTAGGKARGLGHFEATHGDFSMLLSEVDQYRRVTREDVQRVARVYLSPEGRTVVIARPKPASAEEPRPADAPAAGGPVAPASPASP